MIEITFNLLGGIIQMFRNPKRNTIKTCSVNSMEPINHIFVPVKSEYCNPAIWQGQQTTYLHQMIYA